MKIFLDTNIFIRFLIDDHPLFHGECVSLFQKITEGKLIPYTSNIVITELVYVLIKTYKQPRKAMMEKVRRLLNMRNLTIIELTDTKKAIKTYLSMNIKYGDCLISYQIPQGVILVTYDTDFLKFKNLTIKTPKEIVTSYNP